MAEDMNKSAAETEEEYQPDLMTLEDEDGNEVTFEVIVAVGVRLDNGADRPADGAADIIKVFTQGSQVDLSPAVLFKCKIIHSAPSPP